MPGKTIQVENTLSGQLTLGMIQYDNIQPVDENQFESYIQEQLAGLTASILNETPVGFPFMRRLYRDFHVDPTRHRPSSEALWRRFKTTGEFPRVLPPVDLTNLLSLRFQICYGLYDVDRIAGNQVTARVGDETDRYEGIRKETLTFTKKIVLRDKIGAMGNPSADSLRTAVSSSTSQILQTLFIHPAYPDISAVMAETSRLFSLFFHPAAVHSAVI